jgi:hypothetical protein
MFGIKLANVRDKEKGKTNPIGVLFQNENLTALRSRSEVSLEHAALGIGCPPSRQFICVRRTWEL